MLKSSLRKVVPILFFTYLICYLGLFLFCLIFPPPNLLPYFRLDTAAKNGLNLFFEYFIPIHATGVLIAYALFIELTGSSIGKRGGMYKIVSSVLIFFIIISIFYTAIIIWVQPAIISSIKNNISKSTLADRYYKRANEEYITAEKSVGEERNRYYRNAFLYITSSLKIAPEYKPARELETKIRKKISTEEIPLTDIWQSREDEKEEKDKKLIEGLDEDGLMEKANALYAGEDYYSAYYYASMAFRLDNTRLDAKNMIVKAMDKIKSYDLSKEDEKIRNLYLKKQEGYEKLASGEFISAYYLFKELYTEYPDSQDIKDYLDKIEREFLDKLTFFYEELEHLHILVGVENILFINSRDTNADEFVSIDKMVRVRQGTYFFNVEVMRVSSEGEILGHYLAPFGKYKFVDTSKLKGEKGKQQSNHHINFNCIYKNKAISGNNDRSGRELLPTYFVDSQKIENEFENILPLYTDINLIHNFRLAPDTLKRIGLLELLSLAFNPDYEDTGYSRKEAGVEIVTRCMLPFLFIVFSLFSISFGWAGRSRYEIRPSLFTIIFIPIFPVVVTLLVRLIMTGQRIIFSFITLAFPLILALFICLGIQFIFIIIGLIAVAGKITD